jgi:hypothetical protein
VTLLSPRNTKDGYLIESGFITTDKNVKIPNSNSIWSVSGNKKLTTESPIKLRWANDQGITFEKEISIDDKFLFTVKQRVINSTNKKYDFYSYGQIIRNEAPEITYFYILHEGLVATLDDELFKEDYDDIEEKKFSRSSAPRNAKEGYLIESGFITTDKNVKIPNSNSIWSVSGNKKLTTESPIKLRWANDQGITFEKEISIDDKFLFTVKQRVINSTNNKYDFYS